MINIDEVKRLLRGPMIPVITNLNNDLSVDHGAIRENVDPSARVMTDSFSSYTGLGMESKSTG